MLYLHEIVIHDGNVHQHQHYEDPGGEHKAKGLVPRNYETHPIGCYGAIKPYHAVDFPLIPRSEYSERIKNQLTAQARLSDIRLRANKGQGIPSLDQNGKGYCWFHSGTTANMLYRAVANLPYVGLSAYAGACIIKNYRDEGGWGAQGIDFQSSRGVPSEKFWPMKSMDKSHDNAATWENAALHKVTEGWVDTQAAQYDRKMTFEQYCTLNLSGLPTIDDYNWWGHSVCGCDVVDGAAQRGVTRAESGKLMELWEFDRFWGMNHEITGGIGRRIMNSWADSWGARGMGVLTGNQAIPDGGVGLLVAGIAIV